MELLQKELEERPTAERAIRSLGEAVGLSRSTIFRHLHAPSSASSTNSDVELRGRFRASKESANPPSIRLFCPAPQPKPG